MTQNTSTAVMARRTEAPDSLDYFPTPPWATRALVEHVLQPRGVAPEYLTAWEPACGEGHMARPLAEYFGRVLATDVHGYGFGQVHDFLMPYLPAGVDAASRPVDWVVTNPPFRMAEAFINRALDVARGGAAMLVRTAFLESVGRYEGLFRDRPPTVVAQFVERVPMVKGRVDQGAASATAYAWLVWFQDETDAPAFSWVPPCRKALERAGDYRGA